ncbi:putative quinol monooxygenase [Helicobacter aurati]|uniref:putative quinol monooxygenase n=1 Tax=Helicobacter aurati TaxID=137778 RepID=UPI00131531A9|nr:putative quinol monooxygenase [Helicobacter aurati]
MEASQELIVKSRQECGCRFYDLMVKDDNKEILCFLEEWQDKEALDLHMKTEHFIKAMGTLKSFWTQDPQVEIYQEI